MIRKVATRKKIALFFLGVFTLETLLPLRSMALTSGPAQPETKQFAAAGTSEMVDLFTGDFKYNIPLLDVDGYPVNLNYAAGSGMDDEASWVGLGWNLNVGAINRSLRGIPDDANGDPVVTENYMKPKITVGGRVTGRVEVAGFSSDFGKLGLNGSLALSVFSDNYNGYGADVGVGLGASLALSVSGSQTAGLSLGTGISMNSSTQDGVDLSPSISLSVKKQMSDVSTGSAGISANLGYNTREGLKSTTLGASFSAENTLDDNPADNVTNMVTGGTGYSTSHSKTTYNTPPFYPRTELSYKTRSTSYGFDVGGAVYMVYLSGGVTGYKTVREIARLQNENLAYGFMYAERGKQVKNALMDFMREKDNPVVPNLPNLAIPIATPDMFSYSGQAGGGQFRLYRGGSGTFSDAAAEDKTDISAISAEYGFGAYFHGGFTYNDQQVSNKTGKWRDKNDFIKNGDYPAMQAPIEEPAYFKVIGEKNLDNNDFYHKVGAADLVRLALKGKQLSGEIVKGNEPLQLEQNVDAFKKTGRQVRRTPIMALTSKEATAAALDKRIRSYPFNSAADFPADICNVPPQRQFQSYARDSAYRKKDHFSEITVQSESGSRMVYGIPVYNLTQEEYTFSADPKLATTEDKAKNLVRYKLEGGRIAHKHDKTDHYYRMEKQPAYATSYLLSGVLSPDYEDLTGDGITDDDKGSAVKFNYSKLSAPVKWRSPFKTPESGTVGYAQLNRGQLADDTDDKGNIVYGEKELWYLHSIESKTKVAFFITEDREDAYGVQSFHGATSPLKQKKLTEIRLYSKADMSKPIKTVKLQYNASLCPGTPNSGYSGQGKLTLEKVHFEYNGSTRGSEHPYTFQYEKNANYQWLASDRWGSYKPAGSNANDGFGAFRNDEFPYAARTDADNDAGVWQLSRVTLPSGGEIIVDYESDDYAYVQDRRAMEMTRIESLVGGNGGPVSLLSEAAGIRVTLPSVPQEARLTDPVQRREWFFRNYLNGSRNIYAKLSVNVSDQVQSTDEQYYDYVPCYAEVSDVVYPDGGNTAILYFKAERIGKVTSNAFSFAAWQKMRLEYPRYAYPGYKNRIDDDRPVAAAVSALGNAISNFSELRMNFNKRAEKKKFASQVNLAKSFTRLACFRKDKHGGGSRVKRIRINDKWDVMAGGGVASTYGQSYNYTITENGQTYSSGVAAYEPSIGADENPMRMPVPYSQEFKWALSNMFYLEEPMGESLFPAPQVGYRKITVENLDASGTPSDKMGYSVSEFYTAKEFPVVVEQTTPEKVESETKRWYPFFGGDYAHEVYMSQGYVVYLNDMHGKPFREASLNQNREVISSMEYVYNAKEDGGKMRLTQHNPATGSWHGREVEVFADLREQETASTNKMYNAGVDVIPTVWFPFPFPHIPKSQNNDYRLFRSASLLKTVQDYGSLRETIKTVNGSTIKSTNVMLDAMGGPAWLTKTQNEFEDPVYTLTVPAHDVHTGMGAAYKTMGMVVQGFSSNDKGEITSSIRNVLTPGDELVHLQTKKRMWVIKTGENTGDRSVIGEDGRVLPYVSGTVKVVRSGYRNVLDKVSATYVTLKDPGANLSQFFSGLHDEKYPMIDAKAVLYHEAWGKPGDCNMKSCPEGYVLGADGRCYRPANPATPSHQLINGPVNSDYGIYGTYITPAFGNAGNVTHGFWAGGTNSRLNQCGIWSGMAPGGDVRWGTEFCVDIKWPGPTPYPGYVYMGFAADNQAYYYVDGQLISKIYDSDHPDYLANFKSWRLQPVYLPEGKHTFRIEARNDPTSGGTNNIASMGMELYLTDRTQDLFDGNAAVMLSKRIFNTRQLIGDPNVNIYLLSGANRHSEKYNCPNGGNIQVCDGTPNCGVKMPGDCPDGYIPSPDGQSCIPTNAENSDPTLRLVPAKDDEIYDAFGAVLVENGFPNVELTSDFWGGPNNRDCTIPPQEGEEPNPKVCGRLNATGVRLDGNYVDTWVGLTDCFTVQPGAEGYYYFGFGGERIIKIYIDEVEVAIQTLMPQQWNIRKTYLSAGPHVIRIEAKASPPHHVVPAPVWGFEIYGKDRNEIINATLANQPTGVYGTSRYFIPHAAPANTFTRDAAGKIAKGRFMCGPALKVSCKECETISNGMVLNPYLTGYLGNWGLWKEYVYMDKRKDNNVFDHSRKDLDIRKSGTFFLDHPFFYMQAPGKYIQHGNSGNTPGWIVSREATLLDRNSQELESKDALGRYSSARYGFRNTLPIAVAANARHREIFYDGFEDYKFYQQCLAMPMCDVGEFDIRKAIGSNTVVSTDSHTGKYSLNLSSEITLNTWFFTGEHTPGIYLSQNAKKEYFRAPAPWLGLWGFAPEGSKRYVLSAWVKDNQPLSTTPGLNVSLNDIAMTNIVRRATVEGWKLVEVELWTPPVTTIASDSLRLKISGSGNVLIDDIRIFPFDAQIKTYSYDDRSLRLMGELDENNYATFYEYDDEGSLTRVKKETERGIITIKESRTGYKRKTN